jgi:hypothetical protein
MTPESFSPERDAFFVNHGCTIEVMRLAAKTWQRIGNLFRDILLPEHFGNFLQILALSELEMRRV